jgi:hypothetical protein
VKTEDVMFDLRNWSRLAALVVGVLMLLALYSELASAQPAQALPYNQTNIPLSTGNPTFTLHVDLLTGPLRPQLHIHATPDATHPNMTLQVQVDECPFFGNPQCFNSLGEEVQPWISPTAPGAVNWVAPIFQCTPAPFDESITGDTTPECRVRVTATNFGSGGSPATFNLQIVGETRPPTGTVQTVVNTTTGTTGEQDLPLGRADFCTDAANFRWIYDQQDDDIVETFNPATQAQLGRCQGLISNDEDIFGPKYIYTYLGNPSFVGFDCCTWQVDSVDTGTTGSGQALFFLNKPLSSPPPDTDADGFFDPCDNCVNVPNGPFLGTCVSEDGSSVGGPCLSNQQCTGGKFCSMAQEDDDFALTNGGLVCLPEPGASSLLAAGVLGLIVLERRRRRKLSLTASY